MSLTVGTNSYIDVANADIYFAHAIHADKWDESTSATKTDALVTATRTLDRKQWVGTKYGDPQTLDWPRSGVTDREGGAVAADSVPQFVVDATCELALALIQDVSVQAPDGSKIGRIKTGTVEVELVKSGDSISGFPAIVQDIIGYYLAGAADYQGPYVSGTDNESELDTYELNRGY